ncbi:hypothetical protein J2Y63_007023 [Shinella sp. BE166]
MQISLQNDDVAVADFDFSQALRETLVTAADRKKVETGIVK